MSKTIEMIDDHKHDDYSCKDCGWCVCYNYRIQGLTHRQFLTKNKPQYGKEVQRYIAKVQTPKMTKLEEKLKKIKIKGRKKKR